jgi:Flp pilus assembly protein TadG
VEFAIIANVFFIMILACMEFARLNMVRNLAQDAAYYAARHVIVPGASSAEAIAEADRIMSSMLNNGYSIDVSEVNKEVNEVAVTVSVDLSAVAFFTPYFLPETNIETVARMRTERYDGYYEQ